MAETSAPVAIALHGGAGVIDRQAMSAAMERQVLDSLEQALETGHALLRDGAAALDAVEATVAVLEDAPWFNAGKGAAFDAEGGHRLDATVMDGDSGRAGAVADVRTLRHPVRLARAVMEASPHVLLVGEGAERFADTQSRLERVANAWFDTPARREQLRQAQADERRVHTNVPAPDLRGRYFGTVGAVALDRQGRLAAATSTGGMTNKRWGRVGDSALIGAGTWADRHCAVSCTGWGEYFIRAAAAHDIAMRMAYLGEDLAAAAAAVLERVTRAGGDGGVIVVDRGGRVALPFSTQGMYRGWRDAQQRRGVAIFGD